MKRFFTKTGIWLLGGAAVIAVVLCIISALGSGTSLLHNALGVIASPFRSAGAAVVAYIIGEGMAVAASAGGFTNIDGADVLKAIEIVDEKGKQDDHSGDGE